MSSIIKIFRDKVNMMWKREENNEGDDVHKYNVYKCIFMLDYHHNNHVIFHLLSNYIDNIFL